MLETITAVAQAVVACAICYLALAFRAFRAEMRLEIKEAVDKLAHEISKQYVTKDYCALRHQVDEEHRGC